MYDKIYQKQREKTSHSLEEVISRRLEKRLASRVHEELEKKILQVNTEDKQTQ